MTIKRLNKNDILRGKIMDDIAKHFGNSVLGIYDKKLRIEVIDEETGDVIQFSIAPVVHKELVDPEECDEYITTEEKIRIYEESLKKNSPVKSPAKKKDKPAVSQEIKSGEFNFDDASAVTQPSKEDEDEKLAKLLQDIGFSS